MTAVGDRIGMVRAVRIAGPGREFLMDTEPVDIIVDGGRIADIAPTGALKAAGYVLEADGAWAVPGLWDNHVHTVQWALAAERMPLGDCPTASEAAERMRGVPVLTDGRRVGAGFRDALWPDDPSREVLDAATPDAPTYLINSDVHSVWLNSAALEREGFTSPDGMLREEDAFEVSRRLNAASPLHADHAVVRAGNRAAMRGVTGIVDFDMEWNAEAWPRRIAEGFSAHRVEFAFYRAGLERAIAENFRTGDVLPGTDGLIRVGPLKIISDGSLGTRTAACSHAYPDDPSNFGVLTIDPDTLVDLATTATASGLTVAIHAIGDRAVSSALDAFALTGATGSIEHAQLVRRADLARFARLGVIASIQPQHAVDDRDMAESYWAAQSAVGYPLASFVSAGIPLRFGSDAPVAALDPWQGIAAAVARSNDDREPWVPEERLSVDAALSASTRSSLRPGETADIVLCGADPQTADARTLRSMPIGATILGGRATHVA